MAKYLGKETLAEASKTLSGYAMQYSQIGSNAKVSWSRSANDDWETVMLSGTPGIYVGSRKIDGYNMKVYRCGECPHTFYAQTFHASRAKSF